jgi:hypothetical protein
VIVDLEALQEYVPPAGAPVAVHDPWYCGGSDPFPRARLDSVQVNVTEGVTVGVPGAGS